MAKLVYSSIGPVGHYIWWENGKICEKDLKNGANLVLLGLYYVELFLASICSRCVE